MSAPESDDSAGPPATGTDTRHPVAGAAIEIIYYTDPLCCWSWAMEPHWRRLLAEIGPHLVWRYRMGGMIAEWSSYQDPLNAVTRPVQMGPVWIEARHLAGAVVDERIWIEDPPGSSYPACVAVKAAELQSSAAADAYLGRVREAVMTRRRNVARRVVLLELAEALAAEAPDLLNAERFACDLGGEAALAAFREDLTECRYRGIGRFPTLSMRRPEEPRGLVLVGYRPYEALREAVSKVAAGEQGPTQH